MIKITHTEDYRKLRAKEYPPLVDFADAMYWHTQGDDSSLLEAYMAKCAEVKKKYPKLPLPPKKD